MSAATAMRLSASARASGLRTPRFSARDRAAEVSVSSRNSRRMARQTVRSRRVGPTAAAETAGGQSLVTGASTSPDATSVEAAEGRRVPKKVAILVEPSPFTYVCGYQNRFRNLIRYLKDAGTEVLVVTPGRLITEDLSTSERREPLEYHGAKVVETLGFEFPWYEKLHMSFALSPKVLSEIRSFEPDVIHCSSPGFMVWASILYSKMLKIPLLLSYHTHIPKYVGNYGLGFMYKFSWALIRFVHSLADMTLVTSNVILNEFKQEKIAAEEKMSVWRKAVDTEIFNPNHRCEKTRMDLCGNNPNAKILMYVGRLGSEKNLDLIKPILEKVRAKHPDTYLVFVGDGPIKEDLEQRFEGTPTVFTGLLRGQELSRVYASADIFVMPSESETLGFVVLEAMASGVPVVAAQAGGVPDIIGTCGKYGALFEPGNVEMASDHVDKLLSSAALRRDLGTAGQTKVAQWDWRASTMHVLNDQYCSCIKNFRNKALAWVAFLMAVKKFLKDLFWTNDSNKVAPT